MTLKGWIATTFVAGLLAVSVAGSAGAQMNTGIGVTVNGSAISFTGAQPVEEHGSVLVPLRGVFQALGAHVDYDPDTQVITAFGNDRHIRLAVDSTSATINGQEQQLSMPAQVVNGYTLVPLRFVAEALGDYVEWDAVNHIVVITAAAQPIVLAHHDYSQDQGVVSGYIVRVLADTSPQSVVVNVGGADRVIRVADGASIMRGADRDSAQTAGLIDLHRGDRVWVRENDHGWAMKITAIYGR